MEANELMINDWVTFAEDPNIIIWIKSINLDDTVWAMLDYDDEGCDKIDVNDLAPIPLTAEMLEKNGFKRVNTQRWEFGEYESGHYICANPKRGFLYVNGERNRNHCNAYDSFFVHTLQHALRLCGLNELADNWRI